MNYEDMKAQMQVLREQMQKQARVYFKEGCNKLFEKHPELDGFNWTEYTPYFNDGDTCEFSANTDYPDIIVDGVEYGDYGESLGDKEHELQKSVIKFLSIFDNDDLLNMFGDHVKVFVTRDDVKVEDYEHD